MVPVTSRDWTMLKTQTSFVSDSYDEFTSKKFQGAFLKMLYEFSEKEKDNINEETIELLEPYLTLKNPKGEELFAPQVAKIASAALGGLCIWAQAMSDYHKASKIVKPKLIILQARTLQLEEAENKLRLAEAELREVERLKAELKAKFDAQIAARDALSEKANKTKRKMEQANKLINSLADNKVRWV
jgi:dynein heavy chain, axonemal